MNVVIADVEPWIEIGGQIAAIVICVFIFVFVLITLVFHLAMSFGLGWLREKARLVAKLRVPLVHLLEQKRIVQSGGELGEDESSLVKIATTVPIQTRKVEQKVDVTTRKVASSAIEVRARVEQAKAVFKGIFLPGLVRRERLEKEQKQEQKAQSAPSPEPARLVEVEKPLEMVQTTARKRK